VKYYFIQRLTATGFVRSFDLHRPVASRAPFRAAGPPFPFYPITYAVCVSENPRLGREITYTTVFIAYFSDSGTAATAIVFTGVFIL